MPVALTRSGGATTLFDKTTKDRRVTGRERNVGDAGAGILSIISKEMHVEGNCETNGQLLIEGKISGNAIAQSIDVASVKPGSSSKTRAFLEVSSMHAT